MSKHLGVNIDHVATLRQVRLTDYPEPAQAAILAEQAGADSITVHLREDRRHIQEHDIYTLRDTISIPMNLEMAIAEPMLQFAEKIQPEFCCLVPENREELTTEGGLDVVSQIAKVGEACVRLQTAGIRVSLFIDPDEKQIAAAYNASTQVIELHTGTYADADDAEMVRTELQKITQGVSQAKALGLQVNAGHGLNYHNVVSIAEITGIKELNIGHSIVAQALFIGFGEAVSSMKKLINQKG